MRASLTPRSGTISYNVTVGPTVAEMLFILILWSPSVFIIFSLFSKTSELSNALSDLCSLRIETGGNLYLDRSSLGS